MSEANELGRQLGAILRQCHLGEADRRKVVYIVSTAYADSLLPSDTPFDEAERDIQRRAMTELEEGASNGQPA